MICVYYIVKCSPTMLNANQFVDQIVTALKSQQGFDPLNIPEQQLDINEKLWGINIKGDIVLTNTLITGLSHIRRIGDAKLDNKEGCHFLAELHLGDSNLKIHSDVSLNLGTMLHPNLQIDADIGDIGLVFSVIIGADGAPSIGVFNIDQLKHVKVHVHGLSVLGLLVGFVADSFVAHANTHVRTMLNALIRPIIDSQIKNFNLLG